MLAPPNRTMPLLYAIILVDVVVGAAVGPVLPEFVRGLREPQLWLSVGTGVFLGVQLFSAPLLGRLLTAQITGGPLPLEQGLVDAVDPARFQVRAARREAPA